MLIDQLRKSVIDDIHEIPTVAKCWPIWKTAIKRRVQDWNDPEQVLRLGESLSAVFATTKKESGPRSMEEAQGDASRSGVAWEALVCWYLNLCLIGTEAVVIKKRSSVQGIIADAITVKYGPHHVNSESDLLAITFPSQLPFVGSRVQSLKACWSVINDTLSTRGLKETCLTVIQCKTNWNENAQIPMLWNLLYQADTFRNPGVSVGVNNAAPEHFQVFRYAFVTGPTNPPEEYKPTGVNIIRLADLTGGHYWGYPSKNGVAAGIHEIFATAAIGPAAGRGVKEALRSKLPFLHTEYDYFRL